MACRRPRPVEFPLFGDRENDDGSSAGSTNDEKFRFSRITGRSPRRPRPQGDPPAVMAMVPFKQNSLTGVVGVEPLNNCKLRALQEERYGGAGAFRRVAQPADKSTRCRRITERCSRRVAL